MKCLLLAPTRYPFIRSITAGLETLGVEVRPVDYMDFFGPRSNRIYNDYSALPRKVRRLWEGPYVRKANAEYLRIFREYAPDLVFIYNDQLVQPETMTVFGKKARIAFFLGDNPLYTPTNIHNLSILYHSDYTITPDTFWRQQLTRMGIDNVVFDCFGINEAAYHPMEVSPEQRQAYGSDLIYVGSASKTNWGYKRSLFLDLFSDLDLKAYISGNGMDRWHDRFPGLAQRIIPHDRFDVGFNNLVYNCSKVAPVEQVPSLFHGIHVRVFDVLGAGILPLCEDSSDLRQVFTGIELPLITDYREAADMARHWIANGERRHELVGQLRQRAIERHAPDLVVRRMMDQLFPSWS